MGCSSMKCLLCLDYSSSRLSIFNSVSQSDETSQENVDSNTIAKNADAISVLASHLDMEFLCRKIFEIPEDICKPILQDYEQSSSWVYCCEPCTALINKAKCIFDEITHLQKQFSELQVKLKGSVVKSVKSYASNDADELFGSVITRLANCCSTGTVDFPAAEVKFENVDVWTESNSSHWSPIEFNTCSIDPAEVEEKLNINDKKNDVVNEDILENSAEKQITSNFGNRRSTIVSKTHTEESAYNCSPNLHTRLKIYPGRKCHQCEKTFKNLSELKRHTAISCTMVAKNNKCNKSFEDEHVKRILFEKPHQCNWCGKRFRYPYGLRVHLRNHTGERPHKCKICPKSFISTGALAKHKEGHYAEKNLKCYVCGEKFCHIRTLRSHLKIHNGEKPYLCVHCGKGFPHPSNLKRHEKSHKETEHAHFLFQ